MIVLKSKYLKVVQELENLKKELKETEKARKNAVLMYETVNKDEFKTVDQIQHGTVFIYLENKRKFRIVETSPEKFALFIIYDDGTETQSIKPTSHTINKLELFKHLSNEYVKIVEYPKLEQK